MLIEDRFFRIYMDIFGSIIKIIEGYKYIFFVVDFFSKWLEVFLLRI